MQHNMKMRHWYCWIYLPPLLLVAAANGNIWSRRPGQVFELSSNESDYQLQYSCYDLEGVIETPRKPNTFNVTERLCDVLDERRDCKNASLYFFHSQKYGLCISSSTTTLAQESVDLYYTVYFQYLPICESRLHRNRSVRRFSCTNDLGGQGMELAVTIKGHDVPTGSTWMTTFTLKLVLNCSTLHEDITASPVNPDHAYHLPLYPTLGMLGGIIIIILFIILLVVKFLRMIKYKNKQVGSNSSPSLPDTISTGPDPQQATSITIPLDTASMKYPHQVDSDSSACLPDTVPTDSQPQQVNSISPSNSGSCNQQKLSVLCSGATNLIQCMHRQDNSS